MESLVDIALPQGRARRLDAAAETAARLFHERIARSFQPVRVLVFGSRARGTQEADSDADLAVVLSGAGGDRWGVASSMA